MNTQGMDNQQLEVTSKQTLSFTDREIFISKYPLFGLLSRRDVRELALIAREVRLPEGAIITKEGDIVDSVYLIVSGSAKVSREVSSPTKTETMELATLKKGDAIGLSGTGFFARRGIRTATVIAAQPIVLLAFDVIDFQRFLQRPGIATPALKNTGDKILLMNFIQQSNLFKDFSVERIQWLAKHVKKINIPAGATLFKEGEKSDEFYFIVTGCMSVMLEKDKGKIVSLYESNSVIGIDSFVTGKPRDALAKAEVNSELFVISRKEIADAKAWEPTFFENIYATVVENIRSFWER